MTQRILIMASGTGSNTQAIIDYFSKQESVDVAAVISNKPDAGALDIAHASGIQAIHLSNEDIDRGDNLLETVANIDPDLIVLAGFLRKIPERLIEAYPHRIVNIHPSLLPKHGGKGMYGNRVHRAVIDAGDPSTGITIHEVDLEYDTGKVLFQAACDISPLDTPESVAVKVQELEHEFYPRVIHDHLKSLNRKHAH